MHLLLQILGFSDSHMTSNHLVELPFPTLDPANTPRRLRYRYRTEPVGRHRWKVIATPYFQ